MSESLTGVGAIFSAAHRDRPTGKLHGHTWEVTAWFSGRPDANSKQAQLNNFLSAIDHTELSGELAWGEDLAAWIGNNLMCQQVDVSRPLERIYARWVR